jgi:S-DNA-T family DNA segregation ATPase FtsK/SpoIIIE
MRYLWRHRVLSALGGAWIALVVFEGPQIAVGAVLGLAVALVAWRVFHPETFNLHVSERHEKSRRRHWYRDHWQHLMTSHKLVGTKLGKTTYPKLGRIDMGAWKDTLHVTPSFGHDIDDWRVRADALNLAAGSRSVRVLEGHRPGHLIVELTWSDPLSALVPAFPILPASQVDLAHLPIGVLEDGSTWNIALQGNHILIGGVTGSGKGSVLWSILRGVFSHIQEGSVEVWAIDPKGGMELRPGLPLFAHYADESFAQMADMLEDAVSFMKQRSSRYAGHTRKHRASVEEPLVMVVVDELANLTAYLPDKKIKDRISQSLSLLLTQGRAVGVTVIAALQDPRKDIIPFRNLFPTKIALRMDEAVQCDMVLGEGARKAGAYCDRIPESTPGVAYQKVDGSKEPSRVRASYVTDDDIALMASTARGDEFADVDPGEDVTPVEIPAALTVPEDPVAQSPRP